MSYSVEPIDITLTPKERVIETNSKAKKALLANQYSWWNAQNDKDLCTQVLATTEYLKRTNQQRIRQASIFSRLFSGKPLYNYLASNSALDSSNQLPIGRPTANICFSCTDTLVSRITQDKPKPTFLTDGGHYKERKLSKEANQFIWGEFYRMKTYALGAYAFRDCCVFGDGLIKVFRQGDLVANERVLETELLVDFNDGYYGKPRQLGHIKLVDRAVMAELFPDAEGAILSSAHGNVDSTPRSTETIADQFIISEFWHLPSAEGAKDGRHVIVCSQGVILDEPWTRDHFPFAKIGYNPNPVGFFSQGAVEILMPTQMEIYRMLIVASQAIELMGVPRIYMDEMSKIVETAFNNRIGTIIKGRGAPPEFLNATANNPEIYQWIQWLIANGYQMLGMSQLAASGVKPQGLNSGEAQREYLNTQDERFNAVLRRYQDMYTDLAYLVLEEATDIAEDNGKYETVYPGKDGLRQVDFKSIKMLDDNFVIQCFEESALPKDPAGRQAKLSEMRADGEISQQEFRRLSNFPDLEQEDRLAVALEERILYCLDEIVDNGYKNFSEISPDPFILDPTDMATTKAVNYINLYSTQQLEDTKLQALRDWWTQVQTLKAQANPPPPVVPGGPPGQNPQLPVPGSNPQAPLPVAPPNPSIGPTSGVSV